MKGNCNLNEKLLEELKTKIIIAFDFSINSPAVCIFFNNKIHFLSFIRKSLVSNVKKTRIFYNYFKQNIYFFLNENEISSSEYDYSDFSNKKLEDVEILVSKILVGINEVLIKNYDVKELEEKTEKDFIFVFEGLSFNSTGARTLDLSGYQFVLKFYLKNKFGLSDFKNFYTYSPQTIKKNVGEKNRDKDKSFMLKEFLKILNKNVDLGHFNFLRDVLIQSSFGNVLLNNKSILEELGVEKTKHVVKPLDDVVDSFFILLSFFVENCYENKTNSKTKKRNKTKK